MATSASNPAYRRASVREFRLLDLGEANAELVDGKILMMAGSSARHAAIAANEEGPATAVADPSSN